MALVTGPTRPSFGSRARCAISAVAQPRVTTVSLLSRRGTSRWPARARHCRRRGIHGSREGDDAEARVARAASSASICGVPSEEPLSTTRTSRWGHSVRAKTLSRHRRFSVAVVNVTMTTESSAKASVSASRRDAAPSASPPNTGQPRSPRNRSASARQEGSGTIEAVAPSPRSRRSRSRDSKSRLPAAGCRTRWPSSVSRCRAAESRSPPPGKRTTSNRFSAAIGPAPEIAATASSGPAQSEGGRRRTACAARRNFAIIRPTPRFALAAISQGMLAAVPRRATRFSA